jgi:PAS domain S-box-containing protein
MTAYFILVVFCFLSALITFGLGIFVYAKNSRSVTNRLFLAVMLTATYWAFGEFFIWISGGYDGVLFWLHASALWPFIAAFTVHFVIDFTRHPLSRPGNFRLILGTLYIPAAIFSVLGMLTDLFYIVRFQPGYGYTYVPVRDSAAYGVLCLYIIILMVWSAYTTYTSWRNAARGKIRRQNRLVFLAISMVIGFGAISGLLLPYFGIPTPNFVFIGIALFSLIITYAIIRYGLFNLSPETVAREIIAMMPDGMILADRAGKIVTANASAALIFGVPEKDLTGQSVEEYLPDPDCEAIRQTLRQHRALPDYEAVIGPEGKTIISIAGSLIKDPYGEPAGFILIIRDITGRKASEQALVVANRKISLLTQLTRHDISNLITALGGYLVLLEDKRHGTDDETYIAACLGILEKIGRHLQFSREYQDIGTNQPVWQPLKTMLDRAARDLLAGNVTITIDVPALEIFADPLTIKAFYNLFENAIRHGKTTKEIRVATEIHPSGDLVIIFEDDGAGIRPEDKESIFKYGFGKNTGLGLALSRDILSVTAIRIIEAGAPGQGARFEINVPTTDWRYTLST